ncbi:MAG TPA: hypothetical protein VMC84_01080 [Methanocella sp.]|uniref:hypothetical protein n=1 Tax=Methanocella sp. TaxID=2052833 RepID=UPI002C1B40FA|nr:hypothetical protein [Methanocella sp.]HTY89748.1 hypothetical protein [Methanocella sp.]
MTGITDFAKYGLVILMFLLFLYTSYCMSASYQIPGTDSYYLFPEVKANADAWYGRVVLPGELDATAWVNENLNMSDKFVADIFGAETIMGMTCRVSTVGGDWANAPNPVKVMSDTNQIYTTSSAWEAYSLAKEDNCTYVWLPNRNTFSGYDWVYGEHDKFNDTQYFQLVYENEDVKIYKILEAAQ